MVSILDTGPIIREVDIGGKKVTVNGITFEDIPTLFDRFPDLRKALTPSRTTGELDSDYLSVEGLMKLGPRIVNAVIAAGIGECGSSEAEEASARLPIGTRVKLIKNIFELTFPGGLGPFVDDLRALGLLGIATNGSGATSKAPDTSSSSLSQSYSDGDTKQ